VSAALPEAELQALAERAAPAVSAASSSVWATKNGRGRDMWDSAMVHG
jgi:hypothetical protein